MDGPDEEATAHQRRLWDAVAPRYDSQMRPLERFWFRDGRSWVCARASGRTLEVGIGTGRSLDAYSPDVGLTGVDLSPRMLQLARGRADHLGRDLTAVEADAVDLPFADAAFDSVVCVLALCSIPDPRAALAEMVRVLAPGGRLLLLDHVGSSFAPLWAAQWLVEQLSARVAGEHFTRRQLPLVQEAGLRILETSRRALGTIEMIHAVRA